MAGLPNKQFVQTFVSGSNKNPGCLEIEPRHPTWRIIPVRKWLVTPVYKPFTAFGRGITLLRGLTITMVIGHLLTGMILQVKLLRFQVGTSGIRAHLGLQIPLNCAVRVGCNALTWREGEWTIFNGDLAMFRGRSGPTWMCCWIC